MHDHAQICTHTCPLMMIGGLGHEMRFSFSLAH